MKKLNLGCGWDIKPKNEGWINIDKIKGNGVDMVLDLNDCKTLPFEDNSINHIYASHVIEHLINPHEFMLECYRILKQDGTILIKLPSNNIGVAHLRSFHTESYFYCLTKEGPNFQAGAFFDVVNIKGNRRSLKNIFLRIYLFVKALLVDEYEYVFKKR